MRKSTTILALLLSITSLFAAENKGCKAQSANYYVERERGWFWNEPECVPENNSTKKSDQKKSKYKLIPKKVEVPWQIIDQIDPDQIAELERESQKIAIQYPTDANVKEHRLLQKWIVTKAMSYTKTTDRLNRTDTELAAWGAKNTTSSFAIGSEKRKKIVDRDDVIKSYANKAGLVVIVKHGCGFCTAQKPILDMLKEETGMTYKEVDINETPAIVDKLGVATTPDIFLVLNKNGKPQWQRVASGLNTIIELKEAVVFGLNVMGELKDDSLVYQ